ncbi:putative Protein Hook-like protein 3 [Hypsibius exemplaris]|uniref:Hook C-terminal domain-containing protein n=1 Tax=Hypsibius exemplaris TaxID=2072580 RepID=A0A9X6NG67_HYPEX|nr:putative Protein Hook-like protein 3 [Hypsibius exemplaris]
MALVFGEDRKRFDPVDCSGELFHWVIPKSATEAHTYRPSTICRAEVAVLEALLYLDAAEFSDLSKECGDYGKQAISHVECSTGFRQLLRDRMIEYIMEKQHGLAVDTGRKGLRDLEGRIRADVEMGGIAAVSRILQLLLVCTVLSPKKEKHITRMRQLDERVTVVISKAIVQLLPIEPEDDAVVPCTSCTYEVVKLQKELGQLKSSHVRLKMDLDAALDVDSDRSPAGKKLSQLNREVERLTESLEKAELMTGEFRTRCEVLQDQLNSSIVRTEELTRQTAEMDRLKDQVLEWKEAAGRLAKFESEFRVCQRKLEDAGDLRLELKAAEARNSELVQRCLHLEQENRKVTTLTSKVEALRAALSQRERDDSLSFKRLESAQRRIQSLEEQIDCLARENSKMETLQLSSRYATVLDLDEDNIPRGLDLQAEIGTSMDPPVLSSENHEDVRGGNSHFCMALTVESAEADEIKHHQNESEVKTATEQSCNTGDQEGTRTGGQEGTRTGGQEGTRTGGQEGTRTEDQEGTRTEDQEGTRTGGQEGTRTEDQEGTRTALISDVELAASLEFVPQTEEIGAENCDVPDMMSSVHTYQETNSEREAQTTGTSTMEQQTSQEVPAIAETCLNGCSGGVVDSPNGMELLESSGIESNGYGLGGTTAQRRYRNGRYFTWTELMMCVPCVLLYLFLDYVGRKIFGQHLISLARTPGGCSCLASRILSEPGRRFRTKSCIEGCKVNEATGATNKSNSNEVLEFPPSGSTAQARLRCFRRRLTEARLKRHH